MNSGKDWYSEHLERSEWKLKRLEILERDCFTCLRCKRSGVKLNVHHTEYLSGKKPWEYPDSMLVTLCYSCHSDHHLEKETVFVTMKEVAKFWELKKSFLEPERRFDPGEIWYSLRRRIPLERGAERPLMKFAHWLWNTGTKDTDTILALLEDRVTRNPSNPYAYYAPGGTARDCREAQINIAAAEAKNERLKRDERRDLAGK